MSTQGVGTFAINSFWESGRLIYYEKAYGHTTTGDVFILGADYVQVGDTANDVNFVWKGDTTGTFTLDAGAHTLALTGMAISTDGAVTITNATATSSTTTGALIVTGGIATAADLTVGDDIFMAATGVINFGAGDITFTGGTNVVTIAGGLLTSTNTTGFRSLPVFAPDSTRTNYAYAVGTRATELDVTMATAAGQNLDPIQLNLNIIGTAPTDSTVNGFYQQITHDTTDMPALRLKGCDWTITTDKTCQDAYVVQTELIVSGTKTSSGELMAMSALTTLGTGARTADRVVALQAMITGSGTAGTVVGDCFVAYIVNAGTVITTDAICKIFNQSAATATIGLHIDNDGTVTDMIKVDGGATFLLNLDDATTFVTSGGTDCTASGATDPAYTIKIKDPAGADGYIRVWAAA